VPLVGLGSDGILSSCSQYAQPENNDIDHLVIYGKSRDLLHQDTHIGYYLQQFEYLKV